MNYPFNRERERKQAVPLETFLSDKTMNQSVEALYIIENNYDEDRMLFGLLTVNRD